MPVDIPIKERFQIGVWMPSTKNILDGLGATNNQSVIWILGHFVVHGKEEADNLRRKDAMKLFATGITPTVFEQQINFWKS